MSTAHLSLALAMLTATPTLACAQSEHTEAQLRAWEIAELERRIDRVDHDVIPLVGGIVGLVVGGALIAIAPFVPEPDPFIVIRGSAEASQITVGVIGGAVLVVGFSVLMWGLGRWLDADAHRDRLQERRDEISLRVDGAGVGFSF